MKAFVKSSAKPAFLSVSGDHPTIRAGRGGREEDGEEGREMEISWNLEPWRGPPRPTVLVPEYWFSVTKLPRETGDSCVVNLGHFFEGGCCQPKLTSFEFKKCVKLGGAHHVQLAGGGGGRTDDVDVCERTLVLRPSPSTGNRKISIALQMSSRMV